MVFGRCRNESTDDAEMNCYAAHSAFQILAAAATGKARLPIVDSLKEGTAR